MVGGREGAHGRGDLRAGGLGEFDGPPARGEPEPALLLAPPGGCGSLVPPVAAPGSIVDTQHAWWRGGIRRPIQLARHADQRVGADGDGQPRREARPRLTAQCKAEVSLEVDEAPGSACCSGSTVVQTLGKGSAPAIRIAASKPACLYPQGHRAALPGKILQVALVAAVSRPRWGAAVRTVRRSLAGGGHDRQTIGCWSGPYFDRTPGVAPRA